MVENTADKPSGLSIWLMAIRPKTLILALGPVILAGLLALSSSGPVSWFVFPVIALSAASIQIATNLWNDAADASSGLDKPEERLGPPRVTSLGLVEARTVQKVAFAFLLLAAVCGLLLVVIGGWPIMAIGVIGILCAFGYSSGPYPISGSPFGEIFVVVFFGIMSVMGSSYLITGEWSDVSFWAGLYIGLPAAAVLTVNNHRDRVGDKAGGRRTLAILMGDAKTKRFYVALLMASCLGFVHLFERIDHGTISAFALVGSGLLAIYALLMPVRKLYRAREPKELNLCLLATSMFQLVWVGMFAIVSVLS